MAVLRRCPGCASWYEKREGECPTCGEPPAGFSKHLRTAQLNNHLYGMQQKADYEKRFARESGIA